LDDFYVTYELNAYTDTPREVLNIYSALHRNIQDEFNSAGVEICSPHFSSLRDGNTIAIPEKYIKPDYKAPAFRMNLEDVEKNGARRAISGLSPTNEPPA
jgi:small-conductance mechanosensitive channel